MEQEFTDLSIAGGVAVAAPFLLGVGPRFRLSGVVLEILVEVDSPIGST